MYCYFDQYGNLQEVINDKQIIQSETDNVIYCYFEGITLSSYTYSLTLARPDGSAVTPKTGTLTSAMQIPYSKTRDLRYFKYNTDYVFVQFVLDQITDLTLAGVYAGNPQLSNVAIDFYSPITFTVASNNIEADTTYINPSQFAYLLSLAVGNIYSNGISSSLSGDELTITILTGYSKTAQTQVTLPFSNYVTSSQFSSTLEAYPTRVEVTDILKLYVTRVDFDYNLKSYMPITGGTFIGAVSFNATVTFKENSLVSFLDGVTFAGSVGFGILPTYNSSPLVAQSTFESVFNSTIITSGDVVNKIGSSYVQNASHATNADYATNAGTANYATNAGSTSYAGFVSFSTVLISAGTKKYAMPTGFSYLTGKIIFNISTSVEVYFIKQSTDTKLTKYGNTNTIAGIDVFYNSSADTYNVIITPISGWLTSTPIYLSDVPSSEVSFLFSFSDTSGNGTIGGGIKSAE